jgi:hypothetical protein
VELSIAFEGWVRKQSSADGTLAALGLGWRERFLVLDVARRELRYYASVVESRIGNIPLDERCSIPFETIRMLRVPSTDTQEGRRFDLLVDRPHSSKYPRAFTGGLGSRDSTPAAAPTPAAITNVTPRVLVFVAPDTATRHDWVRHIAACLPPSAGGTLVALERRSPPTEDDADAAAGVIE